MAVGTGSGNKKIAKNTKKFVKQSVQYSATKTVAGQNGVVNENGRPKYAGMKNPSKVTDTQKQARRSFAKASGKLGKGVGNKVNPISKNKETKSIPKRVNQSIVARGGKPVSTYKKKDK